MKRRIISVCLFYCFFRLPIYESIAAIFWQSASCVFDCVIWGHFYFYNPTRDAFQNDDRKLCRLTDMLRTILFNDIKLFSIVIKITQSGHSFTKYINKVTGRFLLGQWPLLKCFRGIDGFLKCNALYRRRRRVQNMKMTHTRTRQSSLPPDWK